MKLIITVDLDNAAFDGSGELHTILTRAAEVIDREFSMAVDPGAALQSCWSQSESIRDSNGNTVGGWEVGEFVELDDMPADDKARVRVFAEVRR